MFYSHLRDKVSFPHIKRQNYSFYILFTFFNSKTWRQKIQH
jgi:hypothetical protein